MRRNKSVRREADPQMKKKWFGSWALGCVVMGGAYILTYILLGLVGFTHDAVYPNRPSFPIQGGNWTYLAIFSAVLFLLPFALSAWFLRWRFREECRPVGLITVGLLAAWAGEKIAIIVLSAQIYGMPLGAALLTRICGGGDPTAPWFTPAYYALTFLGCVLLGQIFGRIPAREKKPAPGF